MPFRRVTCGTTAWRDDSPSSPPFVQRGMQSTVPHVKSPVRPTVTPLVAPEKFHTGTHQLECLHALGESLAFVHIKQLPHWPTRLLTVDSNSWADTLH